MPAKIKARMIWCVPVVVVASWLAVRALDASPAAAFPPTAPLAVSQNESSSDEFGDEFGDNEIGDPSLRAFIGQFADAARSERAGTR
jgi:hypothetical protein